MPVAGCAATAGSAEDFSCQIDTFWPGDSTCTPAATTSMPGARPEAMTASLPSAVATCTGCERTVRLAGSSTQTALPLPSWRRALVGSLSTGAPTRESASGLA